MATVHGNLGKIIGNDPGVQAALDVAAEKVLIRAQALAAGHVDTGAFSRSLGITKDKHRSGVVDRLVVATDPAALSIEVGHVAARKGIGPARFVPGLHILGRAASG